MNQRPSDVLLRQESSGTESEATESLLTNDLGSGRLLIPADLRPSLNKIGSRGDDLTVGFVRHGRAKTMTWMIEMRRMQMHSATAIRSSLPRKTGKPTQPPFCGNREEEPVLLGEAAMSRKGK